MDPAVAPHPLAIEHLPAFITAPGQTDVLFNVVVVFMLVVIFVAGNLYLRLHALPEQLAHKTQKVQFEIVAVLALIALFTHNQVFWIAALVLALIDLPDIISPLRSMAGSLGRIAERGRAPATPETSNVADVGTDAMPKTTVDEATASTTVETGPVAEDAASGENAKAAREGA